MSHARVLIVAPNLLYGPPNPRSIRARRLSAGFAARGFEVEVLTWWSGREEPPQRIGEARVLAVSEGDPLIDPRGLDEWAEAASPQAPDVVYAIGVPTGALVAGARMAARFKVPLAADLGDPWPADTPVERRERSETLAAAAALVTTTEALAARLGPHLAAAASILIAPNGGELRRRHGRAKPPLFVHLGAINGSRVDPRPAYDALTELHGRGTVEFRSHSTGWHPEFDRLPHPHLPMLEHAASLDVLASASAALILGNHDVAQLPSKAFEIACTESWALCVREHDDDPAAMLLAESGHGVVAANDAEAIAAAAEEILARETRGERPTPEPAYSWDARIDALAELVSSCAAGRASARPRS